MVDGSGQRSARGHVQGRTKRELMENLQSALEEALEMNREHALSGMRDIDYQEIELQVSSEA